MRLSEFELNAIKKVFREVFVNGEIYLFGSRVRDDVTGGDIDLFVLNSAEDLTIVYTQKIQFLTKLQLLIGPQKIDLIVSSLNHNDFLQQEALSQGIKL